MSIGSFFKETVGSYFGSHIVPTVISALKSEGGQEVLKTIAPGLFEPLGDEAAFRQTLEQLVPAQKQAIDSLLAQMQPHEQVRFRTIIGKMDVRTETVKTTAGQGVRQRTRERSSVKDYRLLTLQSIADRVISDGVDIVLASLYGDGMIIADPEARRIWRETRDWFARIWRDGFLPSVPRVVWVGLASFFGIAISVASQSWLIFLAFCLIAGGITYWTGRR